MKDGTNRQQGPDQRLGKARLAMLALLLPLALSSTAQTSLHWTAPSSPVATVTTTPVHPSAVEPRQVAYVPPPPHTMPLAPGFDVRQFESIAQALVANQRVPGLAMAIVKDGRILSVRGYGITDMRAAEP